MQDEEYAVNILQAVNNEDPININRVIIEDPPELVEHSDDDEMDLTSEDTSPSSSCDRVSVSNIMHVHDPSRSNHDIGDNIKYSISGIHISALVNNLNSEEVIINSGTYNEDTNQSHQQEEDDEAAQDEEAWDDAARDDSAQLALRRE